MVERMSGKALMKLSSSQSPCMWRQSGPSWIGPLSLQHPQHLRQLKQNLRWGPWSPWMPRR